MFMSRRHATSLFAAMAFATALAPLPALAQAARTGPNGGMVGGYNDHLVELVIKGDAVSVHLLEGGKIAPVGRAQLRLVVQSGGKTTPYALTQAAPDRLTATLAEPLAAGAIVVVSGRDDHGHSVSARFPIR